jgi:hypothetical protein
LRVTQTPGTNRHSQTAGVAVARLAKVRQFTVILVFSSLGCRSVERVPVSASAPRYPSLDLRLTTGARVRVYQPLVDGDSLRGTRKPNQISPVAIATKGIAYAEYSKLQEGLSQLLLLAIPVMAAGIWLLLIMTSGRPSF